MLYLYPKNAVDFTNNGDPIRHSFDEHVIRDDGFYLTFNLLLDKEEEYKKVKKEMIVGAETPDGRNQFRVYDVKKKSTQVEVTAVQLMYDFDNKEVNPFSVKNASGAQIINRFKSSFKSTLGQFTMDSSVTELHDFTTNEEEDDTPSHNALEILNRITKRWDSELMLNGFDIRMIKRLGSKTDALLYEKKNISEFEDVSSVSGMATRIHATSKFTPEGKEDEVTLSVTVDSPLINEYAQIYEKSYVNNDAKTEAELIAWVKLKYSTENIDKPSRTITVETNIIDGTEINYGDDLVMKYLVHDVDEVIRCVGYDYDPIKNTYYSVTLGDWKDSFATTLTGGIVDATNQQLNQIKNNITYISMSANGKNRNAHGPDPVPNPINGDQWFYYELDRPDDVEYRVYQDGFWVKLDFFATKKEVEDVIDQADEDREATEQKLDQAVADAKAYTEQKANEFNNQLETVRADVADTVIKANTAVAKADQAIKDAGFAQTDAGTAKKNAADALNAAGTAISTANTAKTNASTALTTAQTSIVNADTALTNAEKALNKATATETETGKLTASYNELTKTVGLKAEKEEVSAIKGTVTKQSTDILANASAIGAKADKTTVDTINKTVESHSLSIKATADGLATKAEKTLVDSLNGTVTTHTGQIKANADGLAVKADKSLVDTINGTVNTHTSQIKATSDGLGLKADKTLVDTVKSTVDKHTTDIKANADGLKLKAEASAVNTLTGTVNTHTNQISANATAISARLTSAQVDSLVTGKKYVNQTTLDATAKGLSASITKVSSDLSNLETGGQNFARELGGDNYSINRIYASDRTNSKLVTVDKKIWIEYSRYSTLRIGPISILPNTTYTWSFNVYTTGADTQITAQEWGNKSGSNGYNSKAYTIGKTPIKVEHTFTSRQEDISEILHIGSLNEGDNYYFSDFQLQKGNKASAYQVPFEDMATVEQFTTIDATVKGLQTTVGNKADKSQVTQLAGQVSSKVESTLFESRMTQQDKNFNVRVSDVQKNLDGLEIGGRNLVIRNDEWKSRYLTGSETYPNPSNTSTSNSTMRELISVTPGEKLMFTKSKAGDDYWRVSWLNSSKGYVSRFVNTSNKFMMTVPSGAAYMWVSYPTGSNPKVERGNKATDWSPAPEDMADKAKLMSQLNINPEGILLQGKNIQLDGNVSMTSAFVDTLKAKSLEAVYADIATLKTKVLTTDVITSTMLKSDTALISKLFATDANVSILTAKTAFINSVKAVEITADKVNGGTFNAATMNVIGLNANSITSGTLRGANLDLNLNTGMQTFYNPVSAGGNLVLTQGQIRFVRGGMGSRYINYHDEGIIITHGTENTGYTRNTSLHLQGDKAYLQFISNAGLTLQRLESDSIYLTAYVNDSFRVQRYYGTGEWRPIKARSFETSGTANDMEIIENWIRTTNTNDTHIYIEPSRNGNIRVADRALKQYHAVEASNFKVSSERRFKSDINDFDNALSLLSSIKFHKYIKNGESEIGLITDEAPLQLLSKDQTTVDLYSLISLTGGSVQELTQITYSHDRFLNEHDKRLAVLEKENKLLKQKIEKLESAA